MPQKRHDRAVRNAAPAPDAGHTPVNGPAGSQARFGNSFVQDLLLGGSGAERPNAARAEGEPLNAELRGAAERSLGRSLGEVRVHEGPEAANDASRRGAMAYTVGQDIVLGSGVKNRMDPILAHEVSHAAQQGGAPEGATPGAAGPATSSHEQEADEAGAAILAGRPAKVSARGPEVAHFAPGGHRDATVDALKGSFSAQEIASTYSANWERDFSQGPPQIATAVIAWQAVKQSAAKNDGNPDASVVAAFKAAAVTTMTMGTSASMKQSMGGYQPWEHLDNPGSYVADDAETRWEGRSDGLQGYMCDSKAYIKDELVAAVDCFREGTGRGRAGADIDNWRGVEKPAGYDPQAIAAQSKTGGGSDVLSRAPIVAQTTDIATERGAANVPLETGAAPGAQADESAALWAVVGEHLGRSMHSFEDFFSHSNWLELAQRSRQTGAEPKNSEIYTGTFEIPDKCNALGEKLTQVADAFEGDFDLLLKVYGRTEASTRLDPNDHSPGPVGNDGRPGQNTSEHAFVWLRTKSLTTLGELTDVDSMMSAASSIVRNGEATIDDLLTNRAWLAALRSKGERMMEHGERAAASDGHSRLAKDDTGGKPASGKAGQYLSAEAFAARASQSVFGPLRGIMAERDGARARGALLDQLALVDRMMAAPTSSHPLMGLVPNS